VGGPRWATNEIRRLRPTHRLGHLHQPRRPTRANAPCGRDAAQLPIGQIRGFASSRWTLRRARPSRQAS